MSSDTIQAPREIPSSWTLRVNEVAAIIGGQVPLHSHLVAQWMHHAFPRECPFLRERNEASAPVSPDERLKATGQDDVASAKEDRGTLASTSGQASGATKIGLPWSKAERQRAGARTKNLGEVGSVGAASVRSELLSVLKATFRSSATEARVAQLEDTLRPFYSALPKDVEGTIGLQAVRYALYRAFEQRHGWYIIGLEPGDDAWNASAPAGALKNWMPSYVQSVLEHCSQAGRVFARARSVGCQYRGYRTQSVLGASWINP